MREEIPQDVIDVLHEQALEDAKPAWRRKSISVVGIVLLLVVIYLLATYCSGLSYRGCENLEPDPLGGYVCND